MMNKQHSNSILILVLSLFEGSSPMQLDIDPAAAAAKDSSGSKTTTSFGGKVGSYLMGYDSFGETAKMKLSQGQATLPSVMGTFLSFIYFGLVLGYTYLKFDILYARKDVDITLSIKDTHFNDTYPFTGRKDGFNIAVGISSWTSSPEPELPPEYGYIKFQLSHWAVLENGELEYIITDVESHPCSEEELGLTGNNAQFFPMHETSIGWVEMYRQKFVCVNKEDIEINGNFHT